MALVHLNAADGTAVSSALLGNAANSIVGQELNSVLPPGGRFGFSVAVLSPSASHGSTGVYATIAVLGASSVGWVDVPVEGTMNDSTVSISVEGRGDTVSSTLGPASSAVYVLEVSGDQLAGLQVLAVSEAASLLGVLA